MPDQEKNQTQTAQGQDGTVQNQPQEAAMTSEELKKKKRRNAIAIIIILLVIIAVIIYFLTRPKVMTEATYEQIKERVEEEVEEGYFETYMNSEWTFPDGASETTDAILGNSPNNRKPIRYEVLLSDTGEVIYKTGVIPVGAELPPFKLDVDLEAGTYDAVCRVFLMNEEEDGKYTDYSDAGFNVTITILN